jgi:hypothetical protein
MAVGSGMAVAGSGAIAVGAAAVGAGAGVAMVALPAVGTAVASPPVGKMAQAVSPGDMAMAAIAIFTASSIRIENPAVRLKPGSGAFSLACGSMAVPVLSMIFVFSLCERKTKI